jgi:hypothetical protein
MADKTDEPITPAESTPTTPASGSPVYDSLADREPVVATVDSDPVVEKPALVEPEEIVVEDTSAVPVSEPVVNEEPVYTAPEPTYVAPEPTHQPQVVYVNAPTPPAEKGNRGFGVLIAVAATVVFMAVLVVVMTIVYGSILGAVNLGFLGQTAFYVPALFFVVGLIALVLIVNRAGWWTYVIGSVFVGLLVYLGTIAALLLGSNIFAQTAEVAAEQFRQGLADPFTIAAGLVAREVSIWAGAIIAGRGRKVKQRNIEAQAAFQREQSERAQTRGY